ncbi:MAG: glycosyltransferase [Rhodobiaceae bacterium]|nr:glycosyltransferase [Rhodobiaceae bacterium]MCC0041659.1 glycosyltransferase [Rhodobiaceae bacterium]MCC0052592.1 glycosyltransferase [Rhodobiaceae bacterium]
MRIAFYAPLKSPEHPVPSGDRQMARQIMRALQDGGHDVRLVSQLRAHAAEPSHVALEGLKRAAAEETARILSEHAAPGAWRPELWLTYHNYYKAPDLIGPEVAQGLAIAYCGIESSFARKRRSDGWADWSAAAEFGMRRARLSFWLTDVDRQGLSELVPQDRLAAMPPFIDASGFADVSSAGNPEGGPVRFVTVAMMRARAKLDSYRFLAETLAGCADFDWTLDIVGDGPERGAIETLFSPFGERVRFTGELDRAGVAGRFAAADAMLWPGFNEAYGLVYLEAQAAGLPVVALDRGPQHEVVRAGVTGLLTANDPAAYADAVRALAGDRGRRQGMGQAGASFVREDRTIEVAARRFNAAFDTLRSAGAGRSKTAGFPKASAMLDLIGEAGRQIRFWLRDDDAVAPTHQLDRLLETVCGRGLALTLAVIPRYATDALAERLKPEPRVGIATHGLAHINHSPAHEKSSEFGADRPQHEVQGDLQAGVARMRALFGERFADRVLPLFVPPWNRIDARFHGVLADCGYEALSTFGAKGEVADGGLKAMPVHLDIMDWSKRAGREACDIDAELALLLDQRFDSGSDMPVGILTHHLVHDETAWSVLAGLAGLCAGHPAAGWLDVRDVLAGGLADQ